MPGNISFIHSFIHSFSKYLLITYIAEGTENFEVDRTDRILIYKTDRIYFLAEGGRQQANQPVKQIWKLTVLCRELKLNTVMKKPGHNFRLGSQEDFSEVI